MSIPHTENMHDLMAGDPVVAEIRERYLHEYWDREEVALRARVNEEGCNEVFAALIYGGYDDA